MKKKLKEFYEKHEDLIETFGIYGGAMIAGYSILTGFMIIWKKLGLYSK